MCVYEPLNGRPLHACNKLHTEAKKADDIAHTAHAKLVALFMVS